MEYPYHETFAHDRSRDAFADHASRAQTIAVTEVQVVPHRPHYRDPYPSRVSFYSLPAGRLAGTLPTIECHPGVARAPGGRTFLVASVNMLPWAAGDKKTIIREFDPSQGKVVRTFELPASMWEDVTAIPSGVTSRLPSMACSGGLVWLNTTRYDAKTDSPPGNAFVEGIDWEKQKVVASLEVRQFPPPRSQVFLGLYPVGNHCVVIRRELSFDERGMPHKGKIDAVLVWEGGNSEPLDLPAGFGLVAAGKSQLLATVGTEGGILKIDVDSRQHRLSVSGPFKAAELAAGGREGKLYHLFSLDDPAALVAAYQIDHAAQFRSTAGFG